MLSLYAAGPALVIFDYGSCYYSTTKSSVIRARNLPDVESLRDKARLEIEEKRQSQTQLVRSILGSSTRILEVLDGPLRPAAKRTTASKRWRRRDKERIKFGRFKCGDFADELVSALGRPDKVSLRSQRSASP